MKGDYGEITCPHCNTEIPIGWDEIEGSKEDVTIEIQCRNEDCEKTIGFSFSTSIDISEALEIPCQNGGDHTWGKVYDGHGDHYGCRFCSAKKETGNAKD